MEASTKTPGRKLANTAVAFLQCTNLGGMEKVAYSLFERLQSHGFKVKVVTARTWGPGKPIVQRIDPEAQAFNYAGKFGWRTFPAFNRHAQIVSRPSKKVWVIGNCVSCLVAAHLTGKKILMSHHYYHLGSWMARLRWTAFYLIFGFGLDVITYPTEFTRNEARRIAPWLQSKMRIVRNGFDVHYTTEEKRLADRQAARAALGMPPDALLVGNGGWLIQSKRFDVFLKTAQKITRQIPDARFYICGGGPEENNLKNLARELGIADKVHFQGWVQDMTPYYRAWDMVLFNSDFEALGCTPLEAASHGGLCVASCQYGGLSEFIKNGQTGFLFDRHEPDKLAEAIIKLALDPALALEIRQRAIRRLEQEFSNESALKFYEEYFAANSDRLRTD
jgi:glycosyltransferase involved in cell wall biosynthesis